MGLARRLAWDTTGTAERYASPGAPARARPSGGPRREHAPGRNEALEEPPSPIGVDVIVTHATCAGGRVDEAPSPGVDRHVIDAVTFGVEEHEIPRLQRSSRV